MSRFEWKRFFKYPVRIYLACTMLVMTSAQAAPYSLALPDENAVHEALSSSSQIAIAREQQRSLRVQAEQYRDGSHEWTVSATAQQRRVDPASKYQEQDLSIARAWRWYGKAGVDQSRGRQANEIAEFYFEDAWHEAGRMLLSGWFDWLRSASEVRVLEQQLPLFNAQLDATRKRVQTGDAPRLEEQLAAAEVQRAEAVLARARQNMALLESQLTRDFPALALAMPAQLEPPLDLNDSDETWIKRVVDNNHEIELADAEAQLASLTAERAKLDRVADPTIGLRVGRERGGEENIVGLTFSMPLPGAARQNAYQQALADAARMKRQATQARLKVEHDARSDVLNVRSLVTQWTLLASLDTQAAQSAAAMTRGYQLGEFSFTATQTARRQAMDSALAAQKAQLDALQAQARLLVDAHMIWTPEHDHQHPGMQ